MTTLHNIHKKGWFGRTMRLSQLEAGIAQLRAKLKEGEDPWLVAVTDAASPKESPIAGFVARSEVLDELIGEQLNSLGGDLTDIEVEDTKADLDSQLDQGEVIYLVIGPPTNPGSVHVYKF